MNTDTWTAQRQRLESISDWCKIDGEPAMSPLDCKAIAAALARIDRQERALEAAEAAMVYVREQAGEDIGGENYLVSCGGFYRLDAALALVREARKT